MVYIDYLRLLSILAVIFFHLHQNVTYRWPWFSGGYVGVDVFLFLSGFLITNSLGKLRQTSLAKGSQDFLYRRLARIMVPTILVSLIVGAFAVLTQSGGWAPALWSIGFCYNFYLVIRHISYFQNDALPHLFLGMWYLSLLVQLYLVHFLLRITLRRDRYFFASVGVLAAVMLGGSVWLMRHGQSNAAYVLPWHGFPYMIGSLYAGFAGRQTAAASARRYTLLGLAAALGLASIMIVGHYHDFVLYSVGASLCTGLIMIAARRSILLQRLKPGLGSIIGEMSFSLYLWNVPVIASVHHFFGNAPWFDQSLLALILIFALSLLTYRLIEVGLQRLVGKQPRMVIGLAPVLLACLLLSIGGVGWYRAASGQQTIARLAGQIDNLRATNHYLTHRLHRAATRLGADQRAIVADRARRVAMARAQSETQAGRRAVQARDRRLLTWQPKPRMRYVYFDNRRIAQNPLYPDKRVLFITDSILLGWSGYVIHEVPNGYLTGHVGRSFARSGAIIDALKHHRFYHNIKYIIVELGSNGPIARGDLIQFLTLVGARQVLLVIPAVPRPWVSEVARQYRWAQAHYPNVHIVPWNRISAGKANYVIDDQVHLTWFGVQPLMFAIMRKLFALGYRLPAPVPVGASGRVQ